jgi:hypothetical protein
MSHGSPAFLLPPAGRFAMMLLEDHDPLGRNEPMPSYTTRKTAIKRKRIKDKWKRHQKRSRKEWKK